MSSDGSGKPALLPGDHEPAFSMEYRGGTLSGPDEAAVRAMVAKMERSRELRARWPEDGRLAMAALADLFPSMRGVPGTRPWDAEHLIEWCKGGGPTSGSWWAATFLLGVWNMSADWTEDLGPRGRFNLMRAWSCWDENHRAAAMKWLEAPFWP